MHLNKNFFLKHIDRVKISDQSLINNSVNLRIIFYELF